MPVIDPPFWFKQRQCKAEPQGDNMLKASGPNLGEAFLHVAQGDGGLWKAGVRLTADGEDVAASPADYPDQRHAWEMAFELYRNYVIV